MNLARVGLSVIAIVAAVAAVFAIFRAIDQRSAPPIVIEDAARFWPIVVEVRGAVASPGIYELPPESRLQDAALAAGGLTDEADLSTINLARRLRDGEVVIFAAVPGSYGTPTMTAERQIDAETDDNTQININTASVAELELLPGIGEVTAQRIVDFRDANGPYRSIDDLVHVRGISTRTIEQLRALVTTGP